MTNLDNIILFNVLILGNDSMPLIECFHRALSFTFGI